MRRSRLPLTALRAFEAAGRLLSFTAAADELRVTQAAVSRQVRDLEALVGKPLFERLHRRVELTDAGERLMVDLTASFDALERALADVGAGPAPEVLEISVEPSFAACWLLPRLADFRDRHPDIDVSVDSDRRPVEFRASATAAAIRFSSGRSEWPRTTAELLFDACILPVHAPSLRETLPALRDPADLLRWPLIHEETRDMWTAWFRACGVTGDVGRGPLFADGALTLQAARAGQGVALAEPRFAADDLSAGRLVMPFDRPIPCGRYFLVTPQGRRPAPALLRFRAWLLAVVR